MTRPPLRRRPASAARASSTSAATSAGLRPSVDTVTSATCAVRQEPVAVQHVEVGARQDGPARSPPTRASTAAWDTSRCTTSASRRTVRVAGSSTAPPPRATTRSAPSPTSSATISRSSRRKAGSPSVAKICAGVRPVRVVKRLVAVHERNAQPLRDQPSHRRLPRAHEPHEHQGSTPGGSCHGGQCDIAERPAGEGPEDTVTPWTRWSGARRRPSPTSGTGRASPSAASA